MTGFLEGGNGCVICFKRKCQIEAYGNTCIVINIKSNDLQYY